MRTSIYGHHPTFAKLPGKDGERDIYLEQAERWVEDMFAGSKAGLRPLYDALIANGLSVAGDVKACPCKTIVPFYRNHVFAQIKPATRTRIDLGLALGKTKAPEAPDPTRRLQERRPHHAPHRDRRALTTSTPKSCAG